jgi:acyl-[acyl carrier protein]--UDP-N-acetylglucosamine O-acyltransferase
MTIHPTAVIGDPPEHRDHRDQPGRPPMIHHSARVEAFVTVDAGIRAATEIGPRTWLMKRCHVGHDAYIGSDCELAPGCIVGGHVVIEDRVRVGMGAIFKPFVEIGAGARIGCGAVVLQNVPPGEVWAGNPARCISKCPGATSPADEDADERRREAIRLERERIADSVGRPHPGAA